MHILTLRVSALSLSAQCQPPGLKLFLQNYFGAELRGLHSQAELGNEVAH